ncbi:MAG: transposase [Endomicrobiales bacterium]|nr:transposase [Endomicrobiales bacterium]
MVNRKVPLAVGEIYHIFNRSISKFDIFKSENDYERMIKAIHFYKFEDTPCKLSKYIEDKEKYRKKEEKIDKSKMLVKIIAYCLMPTHIHLILEQLKENSISKYMRLVQNSYSTYFNLKYNRLGPLWEGRFKNILVQKDEQFIHLTRYIHLNPVTANIKNINNPINWDYSSYKEYLGLVQKEKMICDFSEYIDISADEYRKFAESQIQYQRELHKIRHLILEPEPVPGTGLGIYG